jgi:hypothetical protein
MQVLKTKSQGITDSIIFEYDREDFQVFSS